jgi:hypothetical protein
MQAVKGSRLARAGVKLKTIKEALVSAVCSAAPGWQHKGADEDLMKPFPGSAMLVASSVPLPTGETAVRSMPEELSSSDVLPSTHQHHGASSFSRLVVLLLCKAAQRSVVALHETDRSRSFLRGETLPGNLLLVAIFVLLPVGETAVRCFHEEFISSDVLPSTHIEQSGAALASSRISDLSFFCCVRLQHCSSIGSRSNA